jgi:hypothetical protein
MLVYIAWFVWIAIWGVIGYCIVKTHVERIRMKREAAEFMARQMAEYRKQQYYTNTGVWPTVDPALLGFNVSEED